MRVFLVLVFLVVSVQGCCVEASPATTRGATAAKSPTSRPMPPASTETPFVEDIHVRIIARPPPEPPSTSGAALVTAYLRLTGNGLAMLDGLGHPVYYSQLEESWRHSRAEARRPFTLTVQVDEDALERFSVAGLSRDISAIRDAAWRAGLSLPDVTVEIIVRPLPPERTQSSSSEQR